MLTALGRDQQARQMADGPTSGADSGVSTSVGATSIADTGKAWTAHADEGRWVITTSGTPALALITDNTGTVQTLERWVAPNAPYGATVATPAGTPSYAVLPGAAPAGVMALSTDTAPVLTGDGRGALASEISHVGGGLNRKAVSVARTAGTNLWTYTAVYTANANDAIPGGGYAVAKVAMALGMTANLFAFIDLLGAIATISQVGDQITVAITITQS